MGPTDTSDVTEVAPEENSQPVEATPVVPSAPLSMEKIMTADELFAGLFSGEKPVHREVVDGKVFFIEELAPHESQNILERQWRELANAKESERDEIKKTLQDDPALYDRLRRDTVQSCVVKDPSQGGGKTVQYFSAIQVDSLFNDGRAKKLFLTLYSLCLKHNPELNPKNGGVLPI